MRIDEIDKNFAVEAKIDFKGDIYDAEEAPIKLYGGFREGELFTRLPKAVAERVNSGVLGLKDHTAGIRVRFATDSKKIAIYASLGQLGIMPHMPFTGQCGFDLYSDSRGYIGTFKPPANIKSGYESLVDTGSSDMDTYTVFFPLYARVKKLYIGLCEGAVLCAPEAYDVELPVVYYGSSITQGGCASKPGDSYQSIISMELKANFINLGFSGNARGEFTIAKYISELKMSAFVYDYDHNAPSEEHLKATHERMFRVIRERNPDLPIIIVTRPKSNLSPSEERRFEIIKATYDNAVAAGDSKVYFVKGNELLGDVGNTALVDGCHPTSLGFYLMAKGIGRAVREALGK